MSKKVTEQEATEVLNLVAEWLGTTNPDGTVTPAPTGKEAAWKALGPMLIMDYEGWHSTAPAAIILEGGPYDWAVDCCYAIQQKCDKNGIQLFLEPMAGYALAIYKN